MQAPSSPLVSVIIPSYDRPDFVKRAIKSVLAQTYENLELHVIDDHSPTPVAELLDQEILSDPRVNIIRIEDNCGANAARNTGMRRATGEYVSFLDDDDMWMKEKVQRQITTFNETDSDVGVVVVGLEYIGEDGTVQGRRIPTGGGIDTKSLLHGRSLAPFSTIMVRSKIINRAGLLDERLPSWQDRDWYLRLSKYCTFEVVPEPLVQKQSGDHEQISDDFESKRDVSYPLLLQKHRETARKYGTLTERRFVAEQSYTLGRDAMKNGYYSDARKYLLRSMYSNPFQFGPIIYLAAATGGTKTHKLFSYIGKKLI